MCLEPLLNIMSAHNLTAIKAPHLVEAAVKVNDVLAATPLVQSVDILSNDASQGTGRLEPGYRGMGGVRFRSGDSRPAQRRSAPISAPFRLVLNELLMQNGVATQPVALVVSIGRYARVATDAGPREGRPWAA